MRCINLIIKTVKLSKLYIFCSILTLFLIVGSISIYAFSNNSFKFIWKKEEEKKYIKWVDFTPTATVLADTAKLDIDSHINTDNLIQYNWIELISYLACKYGGNFKKYNNKDLLELKQKLDSGTTIQELTKDSKYYNYYFEAYDTVLHEFIGEYSVEIKDSETGEITTEMKYGIKVYSPIAKNFSFSHYDDFGNSRSYGFKRIHLGNDLMGSIRNPNNCS